MGHLFIFYVERTLGWIMWRKTFFLRVFMTKSITSLCMRVMWELSNRCKIKFSMNLSILIQMVIRLTWGTLKKSLTIFNYWYWEKVCNFWTLTLKRRCFFLLKNDLSSLMFNKLAFWRVAINHDKLAYFFQVRNSIKIYNNHHILTNTCSNLPIRAVYNIWSNLLIPCRPCKSISCISWWILAVCHM